MAKRWLAIVMAVMLAGASASPVEPAMGTATLLRPAAVFDGIDGKVHANWQVLLAATSGNARWMRWAIVSAR